MSIHKTKGGYFVKYRVNGKSSTKRGFKTKKDAQIFEYKMKMSKENTSYVLFGEVAESVLEYMKNNTTYGTYTKAKLFVDRFILPEMKEKYINKITELDCLNFREKINVLDYSTAYKNDIIWVFKSIFTHAETFYKLETNPSAKIKRFKKKSTEIIESKDREMSIWNDEEFEKFIRCVSNETHRALFITLYYTGLRKGEALALTWNDFKDSKLYINKSLTRKTENGSYEIKDPKNISSIREVSLNKSLNEYLLRYKEKEMKKTGFCDDWFMFGRVLPIAENTLTRAKDKAIKDSGVKRITIHDFRHSHASNLIANGVNIVAVSKRLGHSDINMTLNRYTHLIEKNNRELTDNLEKCSQNVLSIK